MSNAGLLLSFMKKKAINGRNNGNPTRERVEIVTFVFVLSGNRKEQTKQHQIFTASTGNSFDETGTSKSIGA